MVVDVKVVSFKAENELLETIDRVARELGLNRSEVIRVALETYIKIHSVVLSQGAGKKI